MTLREYVNTMAFGLQCPKLVAHPKYEEMKMRYMRNPFALPIVYCKDGFNISIQCKYGNYCASENGIRTFGLDWEKVEWGYPSSEIDPNKYNAECSDTTSTTESVGGYVPIDLLDELLNEHGGIDLQMTLRKAVGLD